MFAWLDAGLRRVRNEGTGAGRDGGSGRPWSWTQSSYSLFLRSFAIKLSAQSFNLIYRNRPK
jgi:hypothetical protein